MVAIAIWSPNCEWERTTMRKIAGTNKTIAPVDDDERNQGNRQCEQQVAIVGIHDVLWTIEFML
jgi:hypothetical protein